MESKIFEVAVAQLIAEGLVEYINPRCLILTRKGYDKAFQVEAKMNDKDALLQSLFFNTTKRP